MIRKPMLGLAVLLALILAGTMIAQEEAPPTVQEPPRRGMGGPPLLGTITSVGVDRFEIKTPGGTAQTILVNQGTQYRVWGQQQAQEIQLEDLKVGDYVAVRGTPNGDKPMVAMGVGRLTKEQFERFQAGGGPGGGPGGQGQRGGWGQGGRQFAGGQIISIQGNQIKVQGRRGERTILINEKTTLSKEGQPATMKDFKVGDRIFALGEEANGQLVAKEIRTGRPEGPGGPGSPGGQVGPGTHQNPTENSPNSN